MSHGVAVVGSGFVARKHLAALAARDDVSIAAVCSTERSAGPARELAAEHGAERVITSFGDVLQDGDVDVVWICTPDETHAALVNGALGAGKHVFCEKPLARRAADFDAIARAVEESGCTLAVGMNCRFRGQYAAVKDAIDAGELGDLRFLRGTYVVNVVETVRTGAKPWMLDHAQGVHPFLHGGGLHTLDLMRWIAGDVFSVFARATGFELGDEWELDTFSLSLEFASGVVGELLVSASAFRPGDFSLEAWGSDGSIVGRDLFKRTGDGVEASGQVHFEQSRLDLELQADDVFAAIEAGSPPLNSFGEARANFAVLEAAERSIISGQPVALRPTNVAGAA